MLICGTVLSKDECGADGKEILMELLFGVSDFGKIKHAEITIGDFTLFVGDNNSGKTFMMQLLYGVLKELNHMETTINGIEEREEKELIYGVEWFRAMEEQVNDYLSENKKKIIRGIFHKDIEIGELYFRLVNADRIYICEIKEYEHNEFGGKKGDIVKKVSGIMARIYIADEKKNHRTRYSNFRFLYHPDMNALRYVLAGRIWRMILGLRNPNNTDLLFLPASRTGLQLLSKYFFAERDRKAVNEISIYDFVDFIDEDGKVHNETNENELGLTMPVYDFLQFLLRYNQKAEMDSWNRDLLKFIEHYLIDGQVKHLGDEIYYHPDTLADGKEDIPLYLASSLVNEITPIIKALSGRYDYKYIFYDEVETCLHPLKQGEMARLLMRLVNRGKRMIISTHSDTMAGKLNNLLLLSFSEDAEEILEKKLNELGLSKDDLLMDAKVHVYQFVNQEDGSSCAEELEFQTMPYIGYDFNLFMKNLDQLYHETDVIIK